MTTFMRWAHRFAVGFQAAAAVLFLWVYTVLGSPGWLVLAGWSIFYGAWSLCALRAEKKSGVQA